MLWANAHTGLRPPGEVGNQLRDGSAGALFLMKVVRRHHEMSGTKPFERPKGVAT